MVLLVLIMLVCNFLNVNINEDFGANANILW